MTTPTSPITIGMVLYPDLTQLDLTGPFEIFARLPDTTVLLVAPIMELVRSDNGLRIMPDVTFTMAPQFDVLFVPGGRGVNAMLDHAPLLDFLQVQAPNARYITPVCTGALLLGAAGLLQGYRATIHWLAMELLPILGVVPVHERVMIDRNRITGGGVTAGIDFALVVVAELHRPEIAQRIQLVMEYDPAPPYEAGSPHRAYPALVQKVTAISAASRAERLRLASIAARLGIVPAVQSQ